MLTPNIINGLPKTIVGDKTFLGDVTFASGKGITFNSYGIKITDTYIQFGNDSNTWGPKLIYNGTTQVKITNAAETALGILLAGTCAADNIEVRGNGSIQTDNDDDDYATFKAIDNDGAAGTHLEVGRLQSANDPYFSFGGSQEFKFYNSGVAELGGVVTMGAESDVTISSGAIAVSKTLHSVIVEGGTGSGADDLSSATGGSEGQLLILKPNTSGANDQVTVKNGIGSGAFILAGGADFVMDSVNDRIMLIHNGTEWVEIARSSGG